LSITLSPGGDGANDIIINTLTDLENSAPTLLKLAGAIVAELDQPVSTFPAASSPVTLKYQGGNNSWTLGNFTFGLCGSVCGSISTLAPGQDLLTYTKTFPTTIGDGFASDTNSAEPRTFTAPVGQYYLLVELDLTLTANVGASVQLGSVGIQGTGAAGGTYKTRFYKKVSGSTLLKEALKSAFAGFVLPLHSKTYQNLAPGDYLYHQFNATMNLGFGGTLGLDKVYFSGQYQSDIQSAPAAPGIDTSVTAEVKAGATFGVTFKYTSSYEAMLWKADATAGRFHLYRSKTADNNFDIGGTITVIADPIVTLSAGSLGTLASQVLKPSTAMVVNQLFSGPAQNEVNNWVTEAGNKINCWLQPFQQGQTALQWAIDQTRSSFLLIDVTFDLTAAGFEQAWDKVIAGDFNGALALPDGGVSLDVGSGLESFYARKTSVTFHLFGLFTAEWDQSHLDNYSILYAGNNTFHLIERIGNRQISTINGRAREVDLYFAAQATSTPAGLTLAQIDLHILLKAKNNAGFGKSIAGFLSETVTGAVATTLAGMLRDSAQQGNSTETLELIFKQSAYGKLTSSETGPRSVLVEAPDTANYNAFAAACDRFESTSPANFSVLNAMDLTYTVWRTWNIAANDTYPAPASDLPSRRNPGNSSLGSPAKSYLDAQFNRPSSWELVDFALQNASDFMNLCEDLKDLATLAKDPGTAWSCLRSDLGRITKNDLPSDFLIPTAFALTTLMGQAGVQPAISGPAPGKAQEPAIVVTLSYS